MDQIILPTVEGMKKEGRTYKGFLYAGLMIEKGAEIDAKDVYGRTPLAYLLMKIYSCQDESKFAQNRTDLVHMLLDANANVDLLNSKEKTILDTIISNSERPAKY